MHQSGRQIKFNILIKLFGPAKFPFLLYPESYCKKVIYTVKFELNCQINFCYLIQQPIFVPLHDFCNNSNVMNILDSVDRSKLPRHIAIIMDGNGRWAKERGEDRVFGHYEGVMSVRDVVDTCGDLGIEYLTLYAFSTENWNRPKAEVDALMELMVSTIRREIIDLLKNNVRVHFIGDIDSLPETCRAEMLDAKARTANNTGLNLILALSYSARQEITEAARKIGADVASGLLKPEDINTAAFEERLYTREYPDPELMIRTSGEHRISNFLLYQLAYAELYFTPVHWPDFRKKDLCEAILNYQQRERRFGKTSEQIQKNPNLHA